MIAADWLVCAASLSKQFAATLIALSGLDVGEPVLRLSPRARIPGLGAGLSSTERRVVLADLLMNALRP